MNVYKMQSPGRAFDANSSPGTPSPAPGRDALNGDAAVRAATNDAMTEAATRPLDKPNQRSPEVRILKGLIYSKL